MITNCSLKMQISTQTGTDTETGVIRAGQSISFIQGRVLPARCLPTANNSG